MDVKKTVLLAELAALVKAGAGRLALQRMEALADDAATSPDVRHLKALAYAYCGAVEAAAAIWSALIEEGFWGEELVTELASAYLALEKPAKAEAILNQWVSETGSPVSAPLAAEWVESLLAQFDHTKADEAQQLARRYLHDRPLAQRNAVTRACVIGKDWDGLGEEGRDPVETLKAAAGSLQRHGYLQEAAQALTYLLSFDKDVVSHWTQLALILWQQGDEDRAMGVLADAHEYFNDSPELLETTARIFLNDRNYNLAGICVAQLEELLGSDNDQVLTLAAQVMLGLGDLQAVKELLDKCGDANTALDEARVAFYARINEAASAIHYQDRLVEAADRSPESLLARARLTESAGLREETIEGAKAVLKQLPGSLAASAILVAQQGRGVEREYLYRLRRALHQGNLTARNRAWLCHALADHHHAVGDFDLAAELYARCNALSEPPAAERYQPETHRNWLDEVIDAFSGLRPPVVEAAGGEIAKPVFIVGVPRSGTTLTEQFLVRHPDIRGMGECQHVSLSLGWLLQGENQPLKLAEALNRCSSGQLQALRARFLQLLEPHSALESTAAVGCYFIDKMPDNYTQIGWIFTLFPDARIIYARRDPREIALSCWRANFGAISWAYRIEDIADRIIQHRRIMEFWQNVYGDRLLISDYADLVNQPELQIRKILQYLALPWHPDCSDHTGTRNVVRTASINQVRRPVYSSSIDSWQSYRTILEPAIQAFAGAGLI